MKYDESIIFSIVICSALNHLILDWKFIPFLHCDEGVYLWLTFSKAMTGIECSMLSFCFKFEGFVFILRSLRMFDG